MKVKYLERGIESNFKRIGDHEVTVYFYKAWKSGGLLYGYVDRYNIKAISIEDIISIEE